MFPLLLSLACIERVTDRAVPLDPRFYEGGSDANNPGAGSGQLGLPWAAETGDKVELSFAISGHEPGTVQLDVVVKDAAAPGGLKRVGRVEGAESPLIFSVPTSIKAFAVEVFQDVTQDGPSADDPYATVKIDMSALPEGPIPVVLVVGARPVPTGGGPEGGGGGMAEPWVGYDGETVTFNAVILSDADGEIQVDFAEIDSAAPGGQKRVGQLRLPVAGAFSVEVPKSLEKFRIEAFRDRDGDGPLGDDPYAELTTTVANIGAATVTLQLVAGSRGQAGSGGDGAGAGPGPVGPAVKPQAPWADVSGPTVTFAADVVTATAGEVQIDLNQADPTAPGGQKRVGQVRLMGAGPLTFPVPTSVSSFSIEAFQDLDHDGPDGDEPFAALTVAAAEVQTHATLTLVVGARRQPGAPSAPAPPPSAAAALPAGPSVVLSGSVRAATKQKVVIDIFQAGAGGGSARKHLYKTETTTTTWELRVPTGLGAIEIDAYQDATGDGFTPDDVVTRYAEKLVVSESDIKSLDLALR
ncbi:MAG: hypothetical protein EXR71_19040 [Myxococcales bacterium]|nr:hypothetical protein [Myxococcales bacterium]